MGSRYEVEVTVGSARELKNVNWRDGGDLKPYAVLWLDSDSGAKCSTRVDLDNADRPVWDEKLTLPLSSSGRLDDAVLHIDVVHAAPAGSTPLLIGSARLPLRDVLREAGGIGGGRVSRSLRLHRPSGRPQGRLDVRVAVRQSARGYYDPSSYPPAPHGAGSRDPYAAAPGYGSGGYAGQPPTGYPAAYGAAQQPAVEEKGMGMGAGLAAGVLGGLALAVGASYLEDELEEGVAEKVEEDMARRAGYRDDDSDSD
ncbi:protein SRC2 homolog [Brachypodium distachyon]|uniref:C2 domain-containing protein n=1 Tax=Brachypodium distachyon TaxID=15368 RepID=I1I020_BRADI|nr:protein SRC2 homolog [Brachypodium distachyon]KQJ94675.1 hypothetical protein BRADI_3g12510v3 [Brachypodium distachyon]|eukprot:XP_003571266.1 protein SRC2 homolog [Brachypodium distachyon]